MLRSSNTSSNFRFPPACRSSSMKVREHLAGSGSLRPEHIAHGHRRSDSLRKWGRRNNNRQPTNVAQLLKWNKTSLLSSQILSKLSILKSQPTRSFITIINIAVNAATALLQTFNMMGHQLNIRCYMPFARYTAFSFGQGDYAYESEGIVTMGLLKKGSSYSGAAGFGPVVSGPFHLRPRRTRRAAARISVFMADWHRQTHLEFVLPHLTIQLSLVH